MGSVFPSPSFRSTTVTVGGPPTPAAAAKFGTLVAADTPLVTEVRYNEVSGGNTPVPGFQFSMFPITWL